MRWLTAFLDLPERSYDAGLAFWEGVSGHRRSAPRGVEGEFATLVPSEGDPHLRVQRRRLGHGRVHLDVHVEDPQTAADDALAAGAALGVRHHLGYVVMTSPGGLPFCFVGHAGTTPAAPADWGEGVISAVDQVSLDVPSVHLDDEVSFWAWLTGWERRAVPDHDEFLRLLRPPDQPLHLLIQRLGEAGGTTRAHLDLSTTDRDREVARHEALGAEVVEVLSGWTVLRDPTGTAYCVTDRRPQTRVIGEPAAD